MLGRSDDREWLLLLLCIWREVRPCVWVLKKLKRSSEKRSDREETVTEGTYTSIENIALVNTYIFQRMNVV